MGSACVAATYAQVYAGGLPYGAAYQGLAGVPAGYAAAPVAAYAAAPVAAAPAAPAVPAAYATGPAHVAHPVPAAAAPIPSPGLGLPEAATYALPPVRQVAKAPIVENFVEPVEQCGYK